MKYSICSDCQHEKLCNLDGYYNGKYCNDKVHKTVESESTKRTYEFVSKVHRESLDALGEYERKKSLKYMLIESCETCNLRASSGTCGKDINSICVVTGTIVDKYWRDHDNVRFPEDCPLKDYKERK